MDHTRGSVFEWVSLLEQCKREKVITEDACPDLKAELEISSNVRNLQLW